MSGRRELSLPAWRLLFAIGIAISIVVVIRDVIRDHTKTTVVVATRALPAYHLIGPKDITTKALTHASHDLSTSARVIGSVTTQKIDSGAGFGPDAITAPTSRHSLAGLTFMRFNATAVQMPGIQPGDDVVLRFAPVAPATTTQALSVRALLIDKTSPRPVPPPTSSASPPTTSKVYSTTSAARA